MPRDCVQNLEAHANNGSFGYIKSHNGGRKSLAVPLRRELNLNVKHEQKQVGVAAEGQKETATGRFLRRHKPSI